MRIIRRLQQAWLPLFVIAMYLFLYLPIIIMLVFSFNKNKLGYVWTGFTFEWYQQLFNSRELLFALSNSLIIAFSAVFLSLCLSVMIVYSLGKRLDKFFSLFYASAMVPEIIMAVGLMAIFSQMHVQLGLVTLIIGHTLLGLGFSVPIIHPRYSELQESIIEASYDLGASKWQTFYKIILPYLYPSLLSAGLIVFIFSLDDFLISFFCTGPSSQTLSLYIFAQIRSGVSPTINALSMGMLLVSTILVLLYSWISKKTSSQGII
jgi:spermidine/putrescine transport system permease protein